jgi:hypothetical protein
MNGFGKFVVAAVLSATLLHALPMAASAAASPSRPRCHHQDKTKPVKQTPASDVCCAVHRSAIVQPSGIAQPLAALMGEGYPNALEVVFSYPQIHGRILLSPAPPGNAPLRI